MQNFTSKRKQDKIEPDEVRDYTLKVPLNRRERSYLDSVRGRHSKAEAMRFLLNEERPPQVPELNQGAWVALASASANLNQIARRLNSGDAVQAEEIRELLSQFRAALLGAESSRGAE